MISQNILQLAQEFADTHEGIYKQGTEEMKVHDATHQMFGLGVSLEEEDMVNTISYILTGEEFREDLRGRAENLIALFSDLPVFYELVEALNEVQVQHAV